MDEEMRLDDDNNGGEGDGTVVPDEDYLTLSSLLSRFDFL